MDALRVALACALGLALAPAPARADEPPRVFAHRGHTRVAPENSLAGCRAAFAVGASCEVDVRAARDGALVLMHDASVARTTNGRGRIAALTLAELRRLALHGLGGERPPTLEELLALPRGEHVLLLDLKRSDAAFHARLAAALAADGHGALLGVRDARQARALRAALPRQPQVALIESPREIERLAATGAETIRLKREWLRREPRLAKRVRAAGARLLVLAEDRSPGDLAFALAHAPDALLCEDPERALALLRAGTAGNAPTR